MYNFKKINKITIVRVEEEYYLFNYGNQIVKGSFNDVENYIERTYIALYQEEDKKTMLNLLKEVKNNKCTKKQIEKVLLSINAFDICKDTNTFDEFIRANKKMNYCYAARCFDDDTFLRDAIELSKEDKETYLRIFLLENFITDEVCDIVVERELKENPVPKKSPWYKTVELLINYNTKYEDQIIKAGHFEYLRSEKLFQYVIENINMKYNSHIKALKYISSKTDKYDNELIQLDIDNKNKYTKGAMALTLSDKTDKCDKIIIDNYLPGFNIFERTRKYDKQIIEAISKKRKKLDQDSFVSYIYSIVMKTDEYNIEIMKGFKYINNNLIFDKIVNKDNILEYAEDLYQIKNEYKNIQLLITEATDKYDSYFIKEGDNFPVLSFIFNKGNFSNEDFLEIEYLPAMKALMKDTDKYDDVFLRSSNEGVRAQLLLTGRISLEKFRNDKSYLVQQTLKEEERLIS